MTKIHSLTGGRRIRLADIDPAENGGLSKSQGLERTEKLAKKLSELDDLLDYADETALLIVLQGRDTAGKDGVIRHLLDHVNAISMRVEGFKAPTDEELRHDFLWRVHRRTPGRGELVIFNRSHYEDVLVARVHGLVPKAVWSRRYEHVNAFERLLADSGTIVLKFFLHVSREEQEKRLLAREEEPKKAWKLAVNDWKEREHWDAYTEAYEEALFRCSTPEAPWHVVPSDRKWHRDLVVTQVVVDALESRRKAWMSSLEKRGVAAKAELAAFRAEAAESAAAAESAPARPKRRAAPRRKSKR